MNMKRLLAVILALALVLCALPVVFALETGEQPGVTPEDGDITVDSDDVVVEEEEVLLGDVNGDEEVSGKDVTVLLRYLAAPDSVTCDLEAADYNEDNDISGKDVTLLLRVLAG